MYQALGSSGACTFGSLSVDNSEVKDAGDWEDKFPKTNSEENRAKLNRLIQEFQPDLIISTHPFSSQMCAILKEKGKLKGHPEDHGK